MALKKSLDSPLEEQTICALLHSVHTRHGVVFNHRALRLTLNKVHRRVHQEGLGFLTKTLPRLGKALDKALAGNTMQNAAELGFKTLPGSKLPRFLGELFSKVLSSDGNVLPEPCLQSVAEIRQITYSFYKYELPYSEEQEQQVLSKFKNTERELTTIQEFLSAAGHRQLLQLNNAYTYRTSRSDQSMDAIVRRARASLSDLFAHFDPTNIVPRHGPGAVATRERLWNKFLWTNVSAKITSKYPLDAYFFASKGHVCDRSELFDSIGDKEHPARVILVPKDSRGPRLISCEPVDYQWIQQGLHRALVELVESSELTRWNIHFTDQQPNRFGALLGSRTGEYATLDLNEASDRVSLELVRLLFPPHICEFLEACRTSSTELPCGEVLPLVKFAPMGSSLCFPVLALTIWAILSAAAPDQQQMPSRTSFSKEKWLEATPQWGFVRDEPKLLVYGDDVIVPTAQAENAIKTLESFGLKVNLDKSCIKGQFRESCGMDAFQGVDVTPVRIRTVWSSSPTPDAYVSWIAYANSFFDKQHYAVYWFIVEELERVYGSIPDEGMQLACPSLRLVSESSKNNIRKRWNARKKRTEYQVWDVITPKVSFEYDGYAQLLRYFTEFCPPPKGSEDYQRSVDRAWIPLREASGTPKLAELLSPRSKVSVSEYTRRKTSKLVRRWRSVLNVPRIKTT